MGLGSEASRRKREKRREEERRRAAQRANERDARLNVLQRELFEIVQQIPPDEYGARTARAAAFDAQWRLSHSEEDMAYEEFFVAMKRIAAGLPPYPRQARVAREDLPVRGGRRRFLPGGRRGGSAPPDEGGEP